MAEPWVIVRFWIISVLLALVAISTLKLRVKWNAMDLKAKSGSRRRQEGPGLTTARFLTAGPESSLIAVTDTKAPYRPGGERPLPRWRNLQAGAGRAPYGPEILTDADLVVPSPGIYRTTRSRSRLSDGESPVLN